MKHLIGAFLMGVVVFAARPSGADALGGHDYRTLGVLAGVSFPKAFFAKVDFNVSDSLAFDYQGSIGFFWSIQQIDACYYFSRSDWSTYAGLGVQNWNFYGFSGSTNYVGLIFGTGNSAIAASGSFGLIYVARSGFAMDINVAGDIFVNAAAGLQSRVIPEGNLAFGYFF